MNVKIPLAADGSRYSEATTGLARALGVGKKAEAMILTVIPEHVFLYGHPLADVLRRSGGLKIQIQKAGEKRALELFANLSKSPAAP